PIALKIIRVKMGSGFDVFFYESMKSGHAAIRYYFGFHFSVTLQNASNYGFVVVSILKKFCSLGFVHETGLTAYVGFICFDVPCEFSRISLMQGQAQTLQHEPCGLLGDSQSAVNFQTAHTVFAIDQHPKSSHPLIERDWRILHYSSNLEGELLIAVIAKPDAASLDERMLRSLATGTGHFSIWPAQFDRILKTAFRVGKVNNRLLQGFWLFHESRVAGVYMCVKYINTTAN